ncbi:MAG: PIN domain-containing protein [Verrucomicrobiota bacterium]|jgi:predicted nucleic acid-binding protein
MNATRFLDTSILLYAYDQDAPDKRSVALRLVEQGWSALGQTAISVQVLQEMHVNLERRGVAKAEAAQIIRDYTSWPVVDNSLKILLTALDEQTRWQLSLWDALILAAARASGASEVYTEDFNHGQDYGGIRVINPFR